MRFMVCPVKSEYPAAFDGFEKLPIATPAIHSYVMLLPCEEQYEQPPLSNVVTSIGLLSFDEFPAASLALTVNV